MTNNNQVVEKKKWSETIASPAIVKFINNSLANKKDSDEFITNLTSVVVNNPNLQQCDHYSIITAALQARQNNLSLSPSFGYSYLVPFKNKAVYQLGYKGILQLAIRSSEYKAINVIEIKKGELMSYDRINEIGHFNFIEDDLEREKTETTGYYAYFETANGFRKSLYWSMEKMEAHALKYSQAYKTDKAKGYTYSFWTTQFDEMGKKTMLKQLLTKWGILSTQEQRAYENEDRVFNADGTSFDVNELKIEEEIVINQNTGEVGGVAEEQIIDLDNI